MCGGIQLGGAMGEAQEKHSNERCTWQLHLTEQDNEGECGQVCQVDPHSQEACRVHLGLSLTSGASVGLSCIDRVKLDEKWRKCFHS